VLHGTTEFVEDGLDIGLLHAGLRLDELSQLLGLNETVVIDGLREILPVSQTVAVLVL
jgi:hypothetical protein